MRILIATDAWSPQVNGVVTTLRHTLAELERAGHAVTLVTPDLFRTWPCPTYPEVRLALGAGRAIARMIDDCAPDAVHIETEGPVGLAARAYCLRRGLAFTTAYHTQFPEFVRARCGLPLAVTYRWLRWFHSPAAAMMVATSAMASRLSARGFTNIARWTRGVDTVQFHPALRPTLRDREPVFLYTGRVAVEKSIEDFLSLDLPGVKWVVGDGPARAALQARFPLAIFHGVQHGAELAARYQQADVFVFPSRTDTFGLVLLEAMACGTPVAALPVTGPIDVVRSPRAGVLDDDLRIAALAALALCRDDVRHYAEAYSWAAATREFIGNLARIDAQPAHLVRGMQDAGAMATLAAPY